MQSVDAAAVAQLHAQSMTQGFLARLGRRFLRQLYLGIHEVEGSHVLVAAAGRDVVGFSAYTRDVRGLYSRVLRSRPFRLAWASLPRSLSPWVVGGMIDTLRYPAKQSAQALPPAEILSIAVSDKARGTGVGRKLLERTLELAREDEQPAIKVLAGAELEGANRFYRACGFEKTAEIVQHGETLNVYVKWLAREP